MRRYPYANHGTAIATYFLRIKIFFLVGIRLLFFPSFSTASTCFDAIRLDRLRGEVGRGTIGEQVQMALGRLRGLKANRPDIHQYELAELWRDYVSVLEEFPAFKSHELHIGDDILFTGKRSNEYYFLAITAGPPTQLFYGVRDTPIARDTDWRVGNRRFNEW